jgi:plastocyanin
VALADQASISGTLSNPGDFVETATYTIVPKTGNCPGNSFQTIITVNPAPRVSFSPAPQTICSGQTTQLVTLTSPTPGVNIPWVAQIPAGISGGITSGTNTIAAATLVNNTSASLTVVYAAVAITNGAAGCPGDTSRYNVVVNPKPNIPAQAITVCSREAFAFAPTNNPPSTIVPPGTTYTWTFTDNVNVTGESSSAVSSDSIRQQLVNLTNQTQTVVYQVTPTSGSAGSCGGPMFTFTVTIEPRAEIPVLVDTICSGTSFTATPTNGQPNATTIVPPGTLYSWNAPNPIPGIGGLASGNNQSNISGALTNSTFAPITITYVVGTQS